MESYRHIGLAFNAGLSFNLSINYTDRAVFKKKSDIVITASRRGPQDLLFAVFLLPRFKFFMGLVTSANTLYIISHLVPCIAFNTVITRVYGYTFLQFKVLSSNFSGTNISNRDTMLRCCMFAGADISILGSQKD